MRVRLNLATKPLETHRRFLVFSGAAGVAAGIVFLLLGWHVYSVRKAEAALRTQTEKNQKEIDALVAERNSLDQFFSLQENARLHDRAAYLNTIIDSRSFNWTRMFMDLEKVLPGGVRVFSIEPKQSGAQVSVKLTV